MAWIGPALQVIGTGYSMYQQNQDKKKAERADEENRRIAAWNALMTAAAGGTPQNTYRASAIPGVDYGGAISTAGSVVNSYNQNKEQQDYKQQLLKMRQDQQAATEAQQGIVNANEGRRITIAEGSAASDAAYKKELTNNAWYDRTGKDLDRANQFERDEKDAEDLRKWREDQLKVKREQIAAVAGKEKSMPGAITEGQAVNIITGKKENDPTTVMLATQLKQPVPTGYTHSTRARKTMAKLLKERRGWSDDEVNALLDETDADPLGILGN